MAQPSYLLGAVIADAVDSEELRRQLRSLPRRGPKLHWRQMEPAEKKRSIELIGSFDTYHVVVVAAPVDRRHQERARALCLERLAWELDRQGVERLTLEARQAALMRRDLRTVDALRGRHSLPEKIRVEHGLPSVEPMLWIADQVLGALGESLSGGGDGWFEPVRSATSIVDLPL